MDDILNRGGPLGVALGFTAGALVLLPIGYVYGQLVKEIPDAAGEAVYVAKFFPPVRGRTRAGRGGQLEYIGRETN